MVSCSSWYRVFLVLLLSERASFCKPCFSSCRLAEDSRAANTQNYCLCLAKDGGDFRASWAFYIHEIGIGALHQELLLVFPLLLFWRGMKKILCERHVLVRRSSPPERRLSVFRSRYFTLDVIVGWKDEQFSPWNWIGCKVVCRMGVAWVPKVLS